MQSGVLVTGKENQKQNSNTHYDTKSVINFESKCAPVFFCIHVSFACNQQLANCCHCHVTATAYDSAMQSGVLVTTTEN